MRDELTMIRVDELYHHPKNPRQNIGDITELTKSISLNGIMQNLTVVPGHREGELAYTTGYTVIIGHRRLEASKAAGLDRVPCHIVWDMDDKTQITTMLEENMQRSDLTVFEQAESFQLMLDLGETEADLVDKTGFSKTTIKHRLNLAKLDKDVLKNKTDDEEFQLSITDMYELEKIKNVEKRNEVLRKARKSSELAWLVHSAVADEKREEQYHIFEGWCLDAGLEEAPTNIQKNYWGTHDVIYSIELEDDMEKPDNFDDKVNDECLYFMAYGAGKVIRPMEEVDEEPEEADEEALLREEKDKDFDEICHGFHERLRRFIFEIIDGKIKDIRPDMELYESFFNAFVDTQAVLNISNMSAYLMDKSTWSMTDEEKSDALTIIDEIPIYQRMLLILGYNTTFNNLKGWKDDYKEKEAKKLESALDIFNRWGFTLTDEEEELLDGSSPIYEVTNEK